MPEGYEKIKKSLRKRYPRMSADEIKTRAAKIYNANRPRRRKPVTPYYHRKKG